MVLMRNGGEYTTRYPGSEMVRKGYPLRYRPLVSTTSKSAPVSSCRA